MNNVTVRFDRERLARLKRAYQHALVDGMLSFKFEGNEYLTSYAKYLIEYLENRIGSQDGDQARPDYFSTH